MLRKLGVTVLLMIILAAAVLAILAHSEALPFSVEILENLFTWRDHLILWASVAAGLLTAIVIAIIVSSHKTHAIPHDEPTELDKKALAEMEEEEQAATPEEREETPPRTPRFSSKRLTRIASVVLLGLIVLGVVVRFTAEPLIKRKMLATLSRRLQAPVTTGSTRVSLLRGRVEALDVKVASPAGFKETHLGAVRRAEVDILPLSILFGSLKIQQVEMWDLDLRIEIRDPGVNLEALFYNWIDAKPNTTVKQKPPPPVEIEKIIIHNAKVSVVDGDAVRLVFDKAEIIAKDLTLFRGLSYPVTVQSTSTFEGGRGKGTLNITGTVGPMRNSVCLDLAIKGEQIDVRDLKPYLGDISAIIGGHIASVDGKFVCKKDMVDGTNLVIKSSGGEVYAVGLVGEIGAPKMSGSSTLVNMLLQPLQKALRMLRKILMVDKHTGARETDRKRDR
ncbi:hypothetical protein ACFL01_01410 [Planctomycetota bacterium]